MTWGLPATPAVADPGGGGRGLQVWGSILTMASDEVGCIGLRVCSLGACLVGLLHGAAWFMGIEDGQARRGLAG